MCRSPLEYPPNGKRCSKRGETPEAIEFKRVKDNERRRKNYAAQKAAKAGETTASTTPPVVATTVQLSVAQKEYFAGTKACNEDGSPLKLYHGSSADFDSFGSETLGRGNDAWGNGFYFTNRESVANGYAKESGSPTATVKEFYLNLQNPITVDGREHMSLHASGYEFDSQQALRIVKAHPLARIQPNDEDEMNPLGDYSEKFWDKDEWTDKELDLMWDEVADQYFQNPSWSEMEGFYGKEHGQAYLHAVSETTGHDGVIVDFHDAGKHYVSWFPEQMKLTSNETPDSTHRF